MSSLYLSKEAFYTLMEKQIIERLKPLTHIFKHFFLKPNILSNQVIVREYQGNACGF